VSPRRSERNAGYYSSFNSVFLKLPATLRLRIERRIDEIGSRLATFPHHRLKESNRFRARVGGENVEARGQTATTSLLNDLARNASVLIKQIDGAHSVIAICDDDFPIASISDQQQGRKLIAGRDFHMIFSYVRVGHPQ
jgi:hypothetical protein